jgi:anhydro-N-acetylmuramic acid kinase
MRVVGLISGTSVDGIDVAAADLELRDDELLLRPLGATSLPYPPDLRAALVAAMPPAATTAGTLCALDSRIGQAFAEAAETAVRDLAGGDADLVVSHGQTLYHWVEDTQVLGTLQIGQPAWIAERTGLPVVADLRSRDVAAGGQGAPLASLLDVLLLERPDKGEVPAALNLGGIANLTIIERDRDPVAFDVGPANALIDVVVSHITDGAETFDRDGARGARGRVHQPLLDALLDEPYYDLAPPKSTGKELFHLPYLLDALAETGPVAPDDLVATVTELTAITIARACGNHGVTAVVGAGGGTRNPTLMARLSDRLPGVSITTIDGFGIDADAKEAYTFALIGFLTVQGLPGTVASCTGAARSAVLGCLIPGARGFAMPPAAAAPPTRLRVLIGAEAL